MASFLRPSRSSFSCSCPKAAIADFLRALPKGAPAGGAPLLAPVEPTQEVWAAGVTYLRSRDAREEESAVKDVYTRVYEAKRPELFFKANGWRVAGHGMPIRVRDDSKWNVPEPELALVINSAGEIVGHTVCNDVSSRDIEGDNPLYLPQAKVYNGSCAVGPGIQHRRHREAQGADDRARHHARRQVRVHGRDAHVADQAPARGAGRLPATWSSTFRRGRSCRPAPASSRARTSR